MRKLYFIPLALLGLLAFTGIQAQEEKPDEISIKITRNGEIIRDTTYLTREDGDLERSLEMIDLILGEINNDKEIKTMAFVSDDGKVIRIESEKKHIVVKDKDGTKEEMIIRDGEGKKEKIIIVKDGEVIHSDSPDARVEEFEDADGHSFVFIQKGDEGEEMDMEIKMKSDGNYRFESEDGKVYIIKSMEEDEGKKIEVEVISKEGKEGKKVKEKSEEKK